MALYCGLDPGSHTGMAIWDGASRSFREVATLPLHRALEEVKRWHYTCLMQGVEFRVIFEDARQRTWFPKDRNSSEYRGHLMGAGAAKRDAAIWEEYLTAMHIPFTAQKPRPGTTKWNAEYWSKVTGWTGRTSEHARDAALLVFGRK